LYRGRQGSSEVEQETHKLLVAGPIPAPATTTATQRLSPKQSRILIAVFSDSHDHLPRLDTALTMAQARGIKRGFHLGDFCAPFSVERLARSGLDWQCVWGNNDGDKLGAYHAAADSGVDLEKTDFREVKIDGRHVFLTHYPQIARLAALSGGYDACFFGHNHKLSQEIVGETLLANPGEILGWRSGHASFGVWETKTNQLVHVDIP
jgi:putative phosphoesterase